MTYLESDSTVDAVDVQTSELLIATPDATDPLVDISVHQVLRLLRDQHRLEAAFVGEVLNGQRVCRDAAQAGPAQVIDESGDALEIAFCKQALNVRVAFGCFLSAPVVLQNGTVYGTFYSFSFSADEGTQHQELKKLKLSAQLAGRLIDSRVSAESAKP